MQLGSPSQFGPALAAFIGTRFDLTKPENEKLKDYLQRFSKHLVKCEQRGFAAMLVMPETVRDIELSLFALRGRMMSAAQEASYLQAAGASKTAAKRMQNIYTFGKAYLEFFIKELRAAKIIPPAWSFLPPREAAVKQVPADNRVMSPARRSFRQDLDSPVLKRPATSGPQVPVPAAPSLWPAAAPASGSFPAGQAGPAGGQAPARPTHNGGMRTPGTGWGAMNGGNARFPIRPPVCPVKGGQ